VGTVYHNTATTRSRIVYSPTINKYIHRCGPLTSLESWASAHRINHNQSTRLPLVCLARSATSFCPSIVSTVLPNTSLNLSADASIRRLLVISSGRNSRSGPRMIFVTSSTRNCRPMACSISRLTSVQNGKISKVCSAVIHMHL
jgi:hypothetical protein